MKINQYMMITDHHMLQHSELFTHNLQFNYLAVHFNSPDFEVNPYCADVAFSIGVILK